MSPTPQAISDWINKTSMTSLGGLILQCLWVVGSLSLTFVATRLLMTDPGDYFKKAPIALGNGGPDDVLARMTLYTAMANTYVQQAHNTGQNLAFALMTAWVGTKGLNTLQHGKDRDTSREKIAADADARVTVSESKARMTMEHEAAEHADGRPVVNVERIDEVRVVESAPERGRA